MTTIEIPDKQITLSLPGCWEDLTHDQFIEAVDFVFLCHTAGLDPLYCKVELVKRYIGFQESGKGFDMEKREQIASNLAIMAASFDFLFDASGKPNFAFRRWMSPDFTTKGGFFKAPFFEIQNTGADVIMTSITAEQFTDGWEYYKLYLQTNDKRNIDILAGVLYTKPEIYSPREVANTTVGLNSLTDLEKYVIFLQFKSIIDYIYAHPAFGVLFCGGEPAKPDKITLGFGGQIFSLAAKGYGDINTIAKKNFVDFLALMLDMLINDLRTMKDYDMKPHEIAKKTKLPIDVINRLI